MDEDDIDNNGDYEPGVLVPYEEASINSDFARDGLPLEALRERVHLPSGTDFPSIAALDFALGFVYHASGYDLNHSRFRIENSVGYRRYICPRKQDHSHGVMRAFVFPEALPRHGFIRDRLRCSCFCKGLPPPSMRVHPFYDALVTKYESLRLLGNAVAYALLLATYNLPLEIRTYPGRVGGPGSLHRVVLYYHSQVHYGTLQELRLVVSEGVDGSFIAQSPIPPSSRLQLKQCIVCRSSGSDRKLMLGLSCRHSLCDGCVPRFFGRDADDPQLHVGPLVGPFHCPKCRQPLQRTLTTSFPLLPLLRAPFPIFRQGAYTIYTEPTKQSLHSTFIRHVIWHIHATEYTQQMLADLAPIRFRVHARVAEHDHALPITRYIDSLSNQERTRLMEYKRMVDLCHGAWKTVEIFLRQKEVILNWCYVWGEAMPAHMLNADSAYYKRMLEREGYDELKNRATTKHIQCNGIPEFDF